MRNATLVRGTSEIELSKEQYDKIYALIAEYNETGVFTMYIFQDDLPQGIEDWELSGFPYLIIDIYPECPEDIPSMLKQVDEAIVKHFGDY